MIFPTSDLHYTDIDQTFTEIHSQIKKIEIHIVGRSQSYHSSWTVPELRRLLSIHNCMFYADKNIWRLNSDDRVEKKKIEWIRKFCKPFDGMIHEKNTMNKSIFFHFETEVSINNDRSIDLLSKNTTDTFTDFDLVISSIGSYNNFYIPGLEYDKNGTIKNMEGIISNEQGLYVAGWAGVSTKGNLSNTMFDAHKVADYIINDLYISKSTNLSEYRCNIPNVVTKCDWIFHYLKEKSDGVFSGKTFLKSNRGFDFCK